MLARGLADKKLRTIVQANSTYVDGPAVTLSATMNLRLTGISSMATRLVLVDLAEAWRQRCCEVIFESVGGVEAARRVQDGEHFDVVVLASDAIDRLMAAGRI